MKRIASSALLLVFLSAVMIITLVFAPGVARAQSVDACYAVADNGGSFGNEDALVALDRNTGVTTLIGRTGTEHVEAIAFAPGGGNLYSANEDQLGILSLTTGAFSALPNTFGDGDGAAGLLTFDDVDGLTYDATSGILYGTHRRDGADRDLLFQIDRTTGAHIPDAFGAGVDYVLVDGPGVMDDVDDIAVDPTNGVMYAASNDGGDGGVLITIDKSSGAATTIAAFGVDDIEGLAFFNDGQLYGSTGKDGRDASTRNQLYQIDEASGAATLVAPFSDFRDYEALACLVGPTSVSLAGISVDGVATTGLWLAAAIAGLGLVTLLALRKRAFAPAQ